MAKWQDNKSVLVASNYVGTEPIGEMKRWDKKSKSHQDIPCPQIILAYNKNMGGVDLADMLIALYRIRMKTRRWYIKIFWHMIDICKVNAWNLYRRRCNQEGKA